MRPLINRIKIKRAFVLAATFVALSFFAAARAHAVSPDTAEGLAPPCAVLDNFEGRVELLDSSRTHLILTDKKAAIPCGGWVSVADGWAVLKHRDGFSISLAPGTFVELPESDADGKYSGDQLVLYRGQALGTAGSGSGELRVITANARARVSQGTMLVVFSHEEQETQVITLDHLSSLENRFETSRKVAVRAGEGSSLNFRLMRVVPTIPRAIAIAALRSKFQDLHVDERLQAQAIEATRNRSERKFAARLTRDRDADGDAAPVVANRKIASERSNDYTGASYARHDADKALAEKLHNHWVQRMVAGEPVGERILYPDKYYGRHQKVKVVVEDPAAKVVYQQQKREEAEKRRLIEELSQIRED